MENNKENTNCGIYMIKNVINGKVYIGQSKNIKNRKQRHFYELKKGIHYNEHLQRAYDKCNGNFSFEILEYCDHAKLNELEEYYMNKFNSCNTKYGYNKQERFKGTHIISEETKKKMSKIHLGNKYNLGRKASEETKKKMSLIMKNRIYSEEHLRNLKKACVGRRPSEKCREELIKALKGKNHTDEHNEKIKQALSTPENIERARIAQLGKKHKEETILKMKQIHSSPEYVERARLRQLGKKWTDEQRKNRQLSLIKKKEKIKNGELIIKRKYTHLVEEWRILKKQGIPMIAIANKYNIHERTVGKYLNEYYPDPEKLKQDILNHKNKIVYKRSKATRKKMRQAQLGHPVSLETREKLRLFNMKYNHLVEEWKTLKKQGLSYVKIGGIYDINSEVVRRYLTRYYPD